MAGGPVLGNYNFRINASSNVPNVLSGTNAAIAQHTAQLNNLGAAQRKNAAVANRSWKQFMDSTQGRMAASSAAFAIEDFFTVFTMTGWVGGMRAASNNISMLARAVSPGLMGAIAGVTTALLPTLISMLWEGANASKKFAEEQKNLQDVLKGIKKQHEHEQNIKKQQTAFERAMAPGATAADKTQFLESSRDKLDAILGEQLLRNKQENAYRTAMRQMVQKNFPHGMFITLRKGSGFSVAPSGALVPGVSPKQIKVPSSLLAEGDLSKVNILVQEHLKKKGIVLSDSEREQLRKSLKEKLDTHLFTENEDFVKNKEALQDLNKDSRLAAQEMGQIAEQVKQVRVSGDLAPRKPSAGRSYAKGSVEDIARRNELMSMIEETATSTADEEAASLLGDIKGIIENLKDEFSSGKNK